MVKLYEQRPFENPALERCRQNALNAKLNREKKKAARKQGFNSNITKTCQRFALKKSSNP